MTYLPMQSLTVNVFTIGRGDLIRLRGGHRAVTDMRATGPYQKLLILDDGTVCRMGRADTATALRPERHTFG